MMPLWMSASLPPSAEVRVRVLVGRAAVRRPAGVADAGAAVGDRLGVELVDEDLELARALARGRSRRGGRSPRPGGVVPAVLEPPQTTEEHVEAVAADVSDDSTHGDDLRLREAWRTVRSYDARLAPQSRRRRLATAATADPRLPRPSTPRPSSRSSAPTGRRSRRSTALPLTRDRDRPAARARRPARHARRSPRSTCPLQPPADPLRRRRASSCTRDQPLPRRARATHPVRHRRRRLRRGRQVHRRPAAPRAARPLGRHPARRARHDRRLPATRTPSSSGAGSWTARASRSPTTAGRCCASSPR